MCLRINSNQLARILKVNRGKLEGYVQIIKRQFKSDLEAMGRGTNPDISYCDVDGTKHLCLKETQNKELGDWCTEHDFELFVSN